MRTLPATLQRLEPLTDEELAARIVAGDGPALELLMRRHNQRLFRVARAIVGDDGEAEEVVQETYVRAYTKMGGFEGRSSLVTWLSRIAVHEALRSRRRRRRVREMDPMGMDRVEQTGGEGAGGSGGPMDRAETRSMLLSTMDALPAGLRAVVMLRLVEGLDTRETAACLRMTEANVKVSLHRARRMLAETIQRRAVAELREEFTFAGERCDRIVAGVFGRLGEGGGK